MKFKRIHTVINRSVKPVAAFLALGLGVVACSSGTEADEENSGTDSGESNASFPDYYPDDYDDLIEESQNEEAVDVYSIMSEEDWAPLLEEFNQEYPWIDVRTVDLGTNEVFERYYAETATDAPTADAIVSIAGDGWQRFIDRGEVMPYESPELPNLPDWAADFAEDGLHLISADPFAIAYNESTLPEGAEPPESFSDVVALVESDPANYTGSVATYSADAQWALFWFAESQLGDEFWDGMSSMGDALRLESSGGAIGEKMVAGEYDLAFFVPLSTIPRGSDSFLKFSVMDDVQPISARAIAVTESATAPASAKLLTDFILSETGQLQVPAMERVPYRDDVRDQVEESGWWHYEAIEEEVGEDAIVFMGPNEDLLQDGEFDRINDGFADFQ